MRPPFSGGTCDLFRICASFESSHTACFPWNSPRLGFSLTALHRTLPGNFQRSSRFRGVGIQVTAVIHSRRRMAYLSQYEQRPVLQEKRSSWEAGVARHCFLMAGPTEGGHCGGSLRLCRVGVSNSVDNSSCPLPGLRVSLDSSPGSSRQVFANFGSTSIAAQ